jgi:SEC-C motif
MSVVGRNDPCPCGSGKKYKKCCLETAPAIAAPVRPIRTVHDLDGQVVATIGRWATDRFGEAYAPLDEFPYAIELGTPDVMLFAPWSVYEYFVDGARVAERFLAERGSTQPERTRRWIEAQLRAWLSVWEVVDVEPGTTVSVRDLLTGEERFVHEVQGSRLLVARDAVLARVVDFEDASYFCGMHPYPLAPRAVALYAEQARKAIAQGRRAPKSKPLPVAWLHEEGAADDLIGMWQVGVEAMLRQPLPKLQNTDGDDLLLTTDHYEIASGARDEVERCLRALPWAEEADVEERELVLKFLRPGNPRHASWENTVVGTVRLTDHALRIETNSVKRADLLRGRVEEACGARIRWRARDHADPEVMMRDAPKKRAPREERPPELSEVVRQVKAKHYASWLDTRIPALDGRTPRQAMKTARLRAKLDVLLKELEHNEMRQPAAERFDVASLRRELGLADGDRSAGSAPEQERR